MCEDAAAPPVRRGSSRWRVVRGAVAAPLPPQAPSAAGLNAYAIARHLHASTSEGSGSMRSHLDCSVRLQVLDSSGKAVGFGQPIRVQSDPGTVPLARQTAA